ncbi:MAG TPA: hypothetical protein VJU86_16425 [Pyrinomonadaceae bacterium]|nr:hypothetical protein [Pyrinomonadaceae bacterium]
MTEKIKILFLSSNPWTTSRILVDEEEREIFEKLQEGPYRDRFELHRHAAIRPIDLQRLLMMYKPHIVHFSGHGSKQHKIILGGKPGRGKQVDQHGMVKLFALYKSHVRLVVLNACFTKTQAQSLSQVIDFSVGAGKGIGDKEGVAFAGAFYRALSFGKSVKAAFESAEAELALTKMPRTKGIGFFVREGITDDWFPCDESDLRNNSGSSGKSLTRLSNHAISNNERGVQPKKKTNKFRSEVPALGTRGTDNSEECHDCEHNQLELSSMRKAMDMSALELMLLGDRPSSDLASLQKAKRVRRTKANPGRDDIERRSSVSCSRSYVSFTVKVFKVAIGDSMCVSRIASAGRHQAVRTRAKSANKNVRSEMKKRSGRLLRGTHAKGIVS